MHRSAPIDSLSVAELLGSYAAALPYAPQDRRSSAPPSFSPYLQCRPGDLGRRTEQTEMISNTRGSCEVAAPGREDSSLFGGK